MSGTFDSWITSRVLINTGAPAGSSTGTFENWIAARIPIQTLVTDESVATLTQSAYRWRNDDGDEDTATWLEVENTAATIEAGGGVRLRIQINASGDPSSKAFKLQFREQGSGDPWTDVPLE